MRLVLRVNSGFRREVVEHLSLLDYYAASCGISYHYSPRSNTEKRVSRVQFCLLL